jgi:multicomponent Na+:H+ antiporter subunit D
MSSAGLVGSLPPLAVAVPLAIAGLLLAFSRILPARLPDIVAIVTALATGLCCAVMAAHALDGPLVYWFGNWVPQGGQVVGIGFAVDAAGGAVGAFIGLLFATTLIFAWGYYDEVHAHFHVLMLLFMAGMTGFCLTHDLFNLFVWFEVMSIAAFALTGYALRSSALDGALNFTVVNTVGSYLILGGIGLVYARVGALDFAALANGVAHTPDDPVVTASFCLLATGLLIKAAQVPFQFWLADAHTVAPSPVSVIFSGAMVAIGVFGLARFTFAIFAASPMVMHLAHTLMLGMGASSAVIGGVMAIRQRHIKRLLAFSTISHVGIMLIGLSLLDGTGLAGMLVYLIGHGLVKGALFMIAGILLAILGGIDEIGLRGRGRDIWPAGLAMVLGGLLLGGLPVGLMDEGSASIAAAARHAGAVWAVAASVLGTVCTGGAVLRVAGRVFAGWGATPGEEERAPSEEEQEKADRPLWLMLAPAVLLLILALNGADAAHSFAIRAADAILHANPSSPFARTGAPPGHPPPDAVLPWLSVGLTLLVSAFSLFQRALPRAATSLVNRVLDPPLDLLEKIHSGLIGDYVAWLVVGLALFALVSALS